MCGMQQATSSIRQHTQHTALVRIRQHTSLWVFIDVRHAAGVTNYKSECKESCRQEMVRAVSSPQVGSGHKERDKDTHMPFIGGGLG
jgi:hypothetical protein